MLNADAECAGPMFQKYNLVLRAAIPTAPPFMKNNFAKTCKNNKYSTTIHCINSLIVKCSKLTRATTVYRGSANGLLPNAFWEPNSEGVRGGVEGACAPPPRSQDAGLWVISRDDPRGLCAQVHVNHDRSQRCDGLRGRSAGKSQATPCKLQATSY